jgi:hypothetical protein
MNTKPTLKYYSFDIDDNLLYMDTKIVMEHLIDNEWISEDVPTDIFAKVRNDSNWRYKTGTIIIPYEGKDYTLQGQESFINFHDAGSLKDNTFLTAFKHAVLNKKFAPSWKTFIECLINGTIFSIITSRGHSPKNIRRAIYWLIYEYGLDNFKYMKLKNVKEDESFEDQMIKNLLKFNRIFGIEPEQVVDSYIELCPIYTVKSAFFLETFGNFIVEQAKKIALHDFNKIVHEYATKLDTTAEYGFSDDDPAFVKAAIDQFLELQQTTKNISYSVFDTGKKQINKISL